jgi:hypothetical protein
MLFIVSPSRKPPAESSGKTTQQGGQEDRLLFNDNYSSKLNYDRLFEPTAAGESLRMSRSKQKKSRRLTNLVPKKYSLPKDHFGREI